MSVINKRNAVIGWITVKVGKRAVRRKAQGAAPSARTGGVMAGGVAALAGLLMFKRKRRSTGTETPTRTD